MKILTVTSLYPDVTRPRHGIFIETRLRQLMEREPVSIKVVAPVPWFPFTSPYFGEYARFAQIPPYELRYGIAISHPRYIVIPKIGMNLSVLTMYLSLKKAIARYLQDGYDFDIVDAHYFYPDGISAVMAARRFGKPVVVTARGSDVNVLPRYPLPRRMIRWAAHHADGLATVSAALREKLLSLDTGRQDISVLRNGVDLELFTPRNRATARDKLKISGVMLLSVGNLVPIKRHDLIIEALQVLPDAQLFIIGEGPERKALENLVNKLNLSDRVRFEKNKAQSELVDYYVAADLLVLASRNEGWPNVLLEAMACGTRIVASDIPGIREIVQLESGGQLFSEGDVEALAGTIRTMLQRPVDRLLIRRYAEKFSWDSTVDNQMALFRRAVSRKRAGRQVFHAG